MSHPCISVQLLMPHPLDSYNVLKRFVDESTNEQARPSSDKDEKLWIDLIIKHGITLLAQL